MSKIYTDLKIHPRLLGVTMCNVQETPEAKIDSMVSLLDHYGINVTIPDDIKDFEDLIWVEDMLIDEINSNLEIPEGYIFGAHPDGCLGFWPLEIYDY